jgi:hypothetical protein
MTHEEREACEVAWGSTELLGEESRGPRGQLLHKRGADILSVRRGEPREASDDHRDFDMAQGHGGVGVSPDVQKGEVKVLKDVGADPRGGIVKGDGRGVADGGQETSVGVEGEDVEGDLGEVVARGGGEVAEVGIGEGREGTVGVIAEGFEDETIGRGVLCWLEALEQERVRDQEIMRS